jgi:quinol monooxygenase YgiN
MFARIMEIVPRWEMKPEIIKTVKNEILPLMKEQPGFLEILPFVPELQTDKILVIGLWSEKKHFERYQKDAYPRVQEILKPFLVAPPEFKVYTVETTLCEHFEKALVA